MIVKHLLIVKQLKVKHDNIVTVEREKMREALQRKAEASAESKKKQKMSKDDVEVSAEPGSLALRRLQKPKKKI